MLEHTSSRITPFGLALLAVLGLSSGCLRSAGEDLQPSDGEELQPSDGEEFDDNEKKGGLDGGKQEVIVEAGQFTVQLPSEASGELGLAIRVSHPASDATRYPEGAPVVLDLQGGWSPGTLDNNTGPTNWTEEFGYVAVEVLLPGGRTSDGLVSGGTYDVRGYFSVLAVRDALLYASGQAEDQDGQTLSDRLPFLLEDHVGIVGRSNGGNLAIVALASYASEFPFVRWFAAWESPIGDQYASIELNNNPFYDPETEPCGLTSCPTPGLGAALYWDEGGQTEMPNVGLELPGLPPGRLRVDHPDVPESLYLSFPTDGQDPPRLYPSRELAEILRDNESTLFPFGAAPGWLAISADQNDAYWTPRDASLRIPEVVEALPDLAVIHVQTRVDHVQSSADYPHARSHTDGWMSAGASFVRCNPDAAYVALVNDITDDSTLADNNANDPIPWPGATGWMEPEGPIELVVPAILELADRTYMDQWPVNIEDVYFE